MSCGIVVRQGHRSALSDVVEVGVLDDAYDIFVRVLVAALQNIDLFICCIHKILAKVIVVPRDSLDEIGHVVLFVVIDLLLLDVEEPDELDEVEDESESLSLSLSRCSF